MGVEGKNSLDIPMLKRHTVYRGGYAEEDEVIKNFWKVLDSFSAQEHSLFLRFTWGRSRLPLFSDQFTQELKVSKMPADVPDKTLPVSHTCFFGNYSTFIVYSE